MENRQLLFCKKPDDELFPVNFIVKPLVLLLSVKMLIYPSRVYNIIFCFFVCLFFIIVAVIFGKWKKKNAGKGKESLIKE